ncbi:MAG TPA: A/G-specific adenine glycosylase [Candidatus Methanoculleus thermohydrogenotrophicum]|jgi:A/G-specific adenine glycosylase|nr:A/G-specific adenine glycosylase [Candidatus Methanoculleus thermohydrogenotrophicum]NLM81954.1 A/G-specific adenine glycosylase [Candidatus Methanoculleus thermohydrogenotrophicum]HOB18695.1 A/G-specific adenine glycosylase [Candidatus Methanoculleus thermohydrogenotrophicum]HPZ38765.1 A/G-specific adenine glycosylase [Candidatus Methanoculleus thermohydrogenotrophicum]HQC91937.1 A/G-specific adenine glycosylase [Candidatus Methanoculleus thermohydrogenotrophicum]
MIGVIGTLDPRQNERERQLLKVIREQGNTPDAVCLFQDLILAHYQTYGRDLPWRRTTEPYHILVSEVMLQQTQVERVVLKYPEFLEQFPDLESLARAPRSEVLLAWQGLGYNRRAIALQKTARLVADEYGSNLPADVEMLATLPGIGRATAAAICAYAFNMPVVYIETNIRRIFIHFFFQDRQGVRDDEILPLVEQTLYRENPREWYGALMDYGTVLKKRTANPNRRSASYTRQSRFEGSDRQIRGKILALVLEEGSVTEEEVTARVSRDTVRVRRILEDLKREGFIAESGGTYTCR